MKSKKCNSKGCDNPVWSKGMCKSHTINKKQTTFKSDRKNVKTFDKALNSQIMYQMFMTLWLKRGNKSEVSKERIYGEPSSAHFHHILPKNKYPLAKLDPENIIIMTMDEHNNVENDIYKYDEVNKRREVLLIKYNLKPV